MEWLSLTLLGGALGLDETSVGQTMVSRPIVAASLAGLLMGSLPSGFLLGVFLECLYSPKLKVGGARVPDGASAAIVGGAVAALESNAGGLALGLVIALIVGDVGGRVVVLFRRWCGNVVPLRPGTILPRGHLGRLHLMVVFADFGRGAAVVAIGLTTVPIWVPLARSWPLAPEATLGVLAIAGAMTLGVLWGSGTPSRLRLAFIALGLAASLAIGAA